jgi:hypothetical protein
MSVPADKVIPPAAPATPTKEEKLEKILKDFEAGDTKSNHPGKNLRELLDKSPDLKARILDSVDKGHLEKFALLPAGANAGGTYSPDTKTIELPAQFLNKAHKDKAAASELVFVMGHEIQHSFNSTVSDKATDAFIKDAQKIAKGPGPHDYTATVKTLIQNYREDEAGAHIGGFNAISSQVLKDNPKAGLKELYNANPGRMGDFIERDGKAPAFTYALKPGLTIEADMTLKSSPENVKAMGKHYFDQPPSSARLGTKGNQDYPNYYGEWAVNVINDFEKQALADAKKLDPKAVAPEVKLNLKDIGLDKSLMDTGLKFTDTSPKKPIDIAAASPESAGVAKAEPALYGQALKALEKLDSGVGGQELRNVAATMAAQADKAGMTEISGAVKGSNGSIIAFQGDPSTDQAKRTAVDVDTAKLQPAAKTLEEMPQGPKLATSETPQPQRSQAM